MLAGDASNVNVLSLQDWDDDAVHLGRDAIQVGRDANVKHTSISFGGDLVRMHANVEYAGPGGSAELLGLYFADEGQHLEHRLFADHTAPKTKSHVLYKGALQGQGAHTVWIGNVLIRKVAEGIETYEENRNLVLSDGCQADSVPNLEIETGEIEGAGHASATARFDDEQLFYLRSRGVSEKESRRLVVHGFFNDLIRKVGIPSIEEKLLDDGRGRAGQERAEGLRLMSFERACAVADVPTDEALGVTIGAYDVAVARDGDEFFAIQDLCSHAAVALSEGEVADCTVECWLHGSRFDLRTGKPTGLPGHRTRRDLPRGGPRHPDGVYVDTTTTLNGVTPS